LVKVNISNLVSISEANQNFSRVARLVDENGVAVILKNNVPRYVLIEYSQLGKVEPTEDGEVEKVARRLLSKHRKAFEGLSK
jgi:antitoxin Phd